MVALRTPENEQKYLDYLKNQPATATCPLCEKESVHDFTLWRVVENSFPYDKIATVHHMLIPIRHASEAELTAAEQQEFIHIKASFANEKYDWLIEPTNKNKSIPGHFHLHLII